MIERPASLFERRRRLAIAMMHHIVAAWVNRPCDVADPVVLVADASDDVGRQYLKHDLGASVLIVSAADLAKKLAPLDPLAASYVRKANTAACFCVVCAFNGAICNYINSDSEGLSSDSDPGVPPTCTDATALGAAISN